MEAYYLELAMHLTGGVEGFEEHLDGILDALLSDARVIDPDCVAALADGRVEFALTVRAADQSAALAQASAILHEAIHAAHLADPSWEGGFQETQALIRSTLLTA